MLTDVFVLVAMAATALWFASHLNGRYQERKFYYRMFALRDQLRALARDGVIPEDDMFHYFDRTFCRLIKTHQTLNLFTLIYLWQKYKDEVAMDKKQSILFEYCTSHRDLNRLFLEFVKTVGSYVMGQHKILVGTLTILFKILRLTSKVKGHISKAINGILVYPETSESQNVDLRIIRKHMTAYYH